MVPRGRRTGRRKVEGARRRGKSRREGWEPSSLPGDRRESGSMGFLSESDSKATSCCQAEMTPMRMGFHHHHKYDRMDGVHIHPPAPALHTACDQFLLLPQFDREREREREMAGPKKSKKLRPMRMNNISIPEELLFSEVSSVKSLARRHHGPSFRPPPPRAGAAVLA
jgi:hypothetical protein